MKTRSGTLGDVVLTILLLLLGAGLIYGGAFNVEAGKAMADALRMPLVATCVGAILILSVVLRWVGGCRRPRNSFINFDSEDGSVGISTKAIRDFIERVGKEFASVKSIDSKLVQHKEGLDISMSVKVVSGNKIPELSQVLQRRVRESVRESLGIEAIRHITIQIEEIIGEPTPHQESPEEER